MKLLYIVLLSIALSLQANSTDFTFNVFSELIRDNLNINIMYSSYSLRTALSILLEGNLSVLLIIEGAATQTAIELEQTCLLSSNADERRQSMKESIQSINKENTNYELQTVNALWPLKFINKFIRNNNRSEQFTLLTTFKNAVETYYLAKTQELDYIKETEVILVFSDNLNQNSRTVINKWVSDQTKTKIKELLPVGILSADTRLVITNCIYFKGTWKYQFNPEQTLATPFKINPNTTTQVNMMKLKDAKLPYYEDKQLQMVELPYEGEQISMVLILPPSDANNFEKELTSTNFFTWMEGLKEQKVNLFVPKFKFEWTEKLNQVLQNLGIKQVFSTQADLSKIDGSLGLYVSHVIQKTFIEVNEKGAEAAAQIIQCSQQFQSATAVVVDVKSAAVEKQITFNADHPFFFMIYYKPQKEILFLGKVFNPEIVENNFKMQYFLHDPILEKYVLDDKITKNNTDFAPALSLMTIILLFILLIF